MVDRWRPISAVVDALQDLATSLAKQLSQEQLEEVLQALKLPLWAVAMILEIFLPDRINLLMLW